MYTEWFEAFLGALSFMLVALSVYLWHRAAMVPSLPYQPSLTLAWQSRLHARAGLSASFALFFWASRWYSRQSRPLLETELALATYPIEPPASANRRPPLRQCV